MEEDLRFRFKATFSTGGSLELISGSSAEAFKDPVREEKGSRDVDFREYVETGL